MPTIVFKTRIRTVSENCTLDLVVSHRLVAGEPSAAPRVVKNPPHKGLDILLVSPLTITTTGKLNNRRVSAEDLMTSRIAQHLLGYLKSNSGELGFEVVSDALIAKDTVFCTASRPSWPLESQLPHLKLLGFDMDYSWHETPSPECSGSHGGVSTPFFSRLTLPYATALNDTVERFVKFQMVKRYPRIFGSWIQQLDMEKPFISSIFSSLSNILRRSSNLSFQKSSGTHLKMLEKTMFASLIDSENRLSGYLESPSSLNADKRRESLPVDDETVFVHAMERVYSLAMKRREFKVIASPADDPRVLTYQKSTSTSPNWLHAGDDIFCDQQPLVGFEEEPHSEASDEEGVSFKTSHENRPSHVQRYFSNIDLNKCLGQYGGIPDDGIVMFTSLEEDLFASDLDTQLGIDQFLRTPDSSGDVSRDVELEERTFSPILGSLRASPDPDHMSLNVAQCSENFDIFAPKLDLVLSGSGSSAPSHATPGYRYSESRVERSARTDSPSLISGDTHLQNILQVMEGANLPMPLSASGTVSEWDPCFYSGIGVDFVAMEF